MPLGNQVGWGKKQYCFLDDPRAKRVKIHTDKLKLKQHAYYTQNQKNFNQELGNRIIIIIIIRRRQRQQ